MSSPHRRRALARIGRNLVGYNIQVGSRPVADIGFLDLRTPMSGFALPGWSGAASVSQFIDLRVDVDIAG